MAKKNSFEVALKSAEKELALALKQREKKQRELAELNAGIPHLQQTIQALQRQLHPNAVTFKNSKTGKETTPSGEIRVPEIPAELAEDDLPANVPEELKKLVGPLDLSGQGSIPVKRQADEPTRELTENELLKLGSQVNMRQAVPTLSDDLSSAFASVPKGRK